MNNLVTHLVMCDLVGGVIVVTSSNDICQEVKQQISAAKRYHFSIAWQSESKLLKVTFYHLSNDPGMKAFERITKKTTATFLCTKAMDVLQYNHSGSIGQNRWNAQEVHIYCTAEGTEEWIHLAMPGGRDAKSLNYRIDRFEHWK